MKKFEIAGLLIGVGCACLLTAGSGRAADANADLAKARSLAGADKYLLQTEQLMCREIGPDGRPLRSAMATNVSVESAKVFDNVYFVGGESNGGWLITTSEGYILLDAMYGDSPEKTIIPGMRKFGLDPARIKYILITHAGPDHVGGAACFQAKFGARIVMTKADWDSILDPPANSWLPRLEQLRKAGQFDKIPEPERDWISAPTRDIEGADGQTLALGDVAITMVYTPRVAGGGGLSYVIPVKDLGRPHTWVTWGNTAFPQAPSDKLLYRHSLSHFRRFVDAAKADVVMSSHPFVDGSVERMKELKGRVRGQPNPFVIGTSGVRRFFGILDRCAAVDIANASLAKGAGRPN